MLILTNRNVAHLAARLAAQIAQHLAARPRPGDLAGNPEALITEAEAAALLGLRPSTLCSWRSRGHGPAYLRVGHKRRPPVRYKREVVIAYRDARETDPEEKL